MFARLVNYITPLLSLSYLIKTLGLQSFGLLSTALSLAFFFGSIVDFGFEILGVKTISQKKFFLSECNKIFSTIIVWKAIIFLMLLVLYFLIIVSISSFRLNQNLFLICTGVFLSRVFIMDWFFQGLEKMGYIVITNTIANSIYLLGIFWTVHSSEELHLVVLFKSLGLIFASVLSFCIAVSKFKLKFNLNVFENKIFLKESTHIYLSVLASSLLQNTPVILISSIFNLYITGLYSSIEKIISFGKQILHTTNLAFFPQLSEAYNDNKKSFLILWKKQTVLLFGLSFILAIALVLFKTEIFMLLSINQALDSAYNSFYLTMLLLLVTFTMINSIGFNLLLIQGKNIQISISQVIPTTLFFLAFFLFKNQIDSLTVFALALLSVDILVVLIRLFFINTNKKVTNEQNTYY